MAALQIWIILMTLLNNSLSYISDKNDGAKPGLKKGICVSSTIMSMTAYDCGGLNFSEIPQHLSSSVQILDASSNRIRELTNKSFKKYSSLRKLYLNDNMILTIESSTFDDLTNLDTLDLTMNALIEVPISIFHLPSLQQLMLAKNLRLDVQDLMNRAIPITAPLQYLDISYSPLLTQLPQFGTLMDLVHLNMTGNYITNVSIAHFIGLCNLQYFTGINLTLEFSTACDCKRIDKWFNYIQVKSVPIFSDRCEFARDKCLENMEPTEEERSRHENCKGEFQARQNIRSIARIAYIALGVIGGILLVVGVCYIYNRTQQLPKEPTAKDKKQMRTDNNKVLLMPYNNEDEIDKTNMLK